ncbi:hypothetical protein I4F81_006990 [Pyropia yezoensis]|uniref:Uncharacterized protein n=1 Tax=Pyropia yezoensis TaxID=2788 RepID=A0ACC3C3A2_PYRYE|nr:hypothetical protein I4F81_006990 [Neopyropia yezoensis]
MRHIHLGARDRRAAAIVGAALRGGTLSPTDADGAAAALAAALPDVRRLPAASRALLGRRALAAAAADAADAADVAAAAGAAGAAVAAALHGNGGEGGGSSEEDGSGGADGADAAGGRGGVGMAPAGSANALNELVAPRGGGGAGGASAAPPPPPSTARDAGGGGGRATPGGRRKKKRPRGDVPPDGDGGGGGGGGGATATSGPPTYRVPRPTARLADVGGVDAHLAALTELVALPLTHPELYGHLGVPPPRGVLLHGPPGCGKTLLATALAGELGLPFFRLAATEVVSGPSALREGFATAPAVTWADVGALASVRADLTAAVVAPLRYPAAYAALGLTVPAGVLLYGPPGCGKTLLAKAVAAESGANFISVKGPELLNKWVGESERAVRRLFARARASAPCVLLTELDGVDDRRAVYVVAATNRPDMIDPAMLRPGRLDKLLYVPLPDAASRAAVLATLTRQTPLGDDVDVVAIAADARAERFSGADLGALVREAALGSVHRLKTSPSSSASAGREARTPSSRATAAPTSPPCTAATAALLAAATAAAAPPPSRAATPSHTRIAAR